VKGINRITNPIGHARAKADGFERPLLMDKKIFRYGDAAALVVADTVKNARAAAKLVKIHCEPLPEYLNALDAMADDAIQVHPGAPNVFLQTPVFKGEDTRNVFDQCAYVAEGSFYSSREPHLVIEPDVAQAYIDKDGYLVVHCKSLTLHVIINNLSKGLGWPQDKIRVIENPTGASFGYAMTPATAALAAVAAIATEKPVSLTLTYEEYMHFTGKRAPSYSNGKLGCDKDGKLQAAEFEIAFEKGPYAETSGSLVTKALRFFGAPYYIPNIMGLSKATFSNHNFSTAYRGFGAPQTYTASEQLIDMLAEKVGMDPLEFRYINVLRPGQTSNAGHTFDVYPMEGLLDKIRPRYKAALERAQKESTPDKKRGVGIVCGQYNASSNANDQAEIALELNPDGTVTCFNTWEDQGQGADVGTLVHAHEALRPLGLKPDQIRLYMNDTLLCPKTGPAAGSRSHYMAGNAIIDGAKKLMDAMRKPDGRYRTYEEMVKEGIPTKYKGVHNTSSYTKNLDNNTGQGYPSPEYTYGVFLAEAEVDVNTGHVRVLGMHCATDVGVIGNYLVVDGQAYGGMMHSIGFALKEDYSDVKKHISLIGAGFSYIEDIPDGDNFTVEYNETPRPTGPQGSSGCSELFQSSGHVAVINAIYNACGVRIHTLPATPEKVKAALEAKAKGQIPSQQRYYLGGDMYEILDEMRANPV
jgi:aldehyde oxidoreductase